VVQTLIVVDRRTEAVDLGLEGFSLATETNVPRDQVGSANDVVGSVQCPLLVLYGVPAKFQRLCAERNGSINIVVIVIVVDTVVVDTVAVDIVIDIVIAIDVAVDVVYVATVLGQNYGSIEELLGLLRQGLSMKPVLVVLEQSLGFLDPGVRAFLLNRNVLVDTTIASIVVVLGIRLIVVVVFHWCHPEDGTFLVTSCGIVFSIFGCDCLEGSVIGGPK
jgi:hypothetical protein